MAEELGTRDVLEQVHIRLGNVEQDIRGMRAELRSDIGGVRAEVSELRGDVSARFEAHTRWVVGIIFASWLTIMASMAGIWLKLGELTG